MYEDVCVSALLRSQSDSGCNLYIVQQVEEAVQLQFAFKRSQLDPYFCLEDCCLHLRAWSACIYVKRCSEGNCKTVHYSIALLRIIFAHSLQQHVAQGVQLACMSAASSDS